MPETWVFCDSDSTDNPVEFCGTEDEMVRAGIGLLKRYAETCRVTFLTVWTGYSWRKHGSPYCLITESGIQGVPS